MTFDAQETSREDSQPLILYSFTFGGDTYRFTSYNQTITWLGNIYIATQIDNTSPENSVEDAINQVTITTTLDNPVARKFFANVPGVNGTVTILRANANDPLQETIVEFDGFVASVKFDDSLEAKILCNPEASQLQRTGPRITYQGLCNHVLFDAGCKLSRLTYTYSGQVTAVNGSTITVNGLNAAKGAGWAVGGFVQAPSGAPTDKRMILSQSGDVLTLLLPFSISVSGLIVDVLAGCDHSLTICNSKFSNPLNYGGFAFVPRKNPFNSTLRGGS